MWGYKVLRGKSLAAGLGAAALAAMVSTSASAATVLHEGVVMSGVDVGVLEFSKVYRSGDGLGGGGSSRQLSGDISYIWDTGADNTFGQGTTATFNQQDSLVYSGTYYSSRYDITLVSSDNSVLTVGEELTVPSGSNGTFVTHTISGSLDFKIERFDGNNNLMAALTDTVVFDDQILFSVVNGARAVGDGVEMYLWGDTGDGNPYDDSSTTNSQYQTSSFGWGGWGWGGYGGWGWGGHGGYGGCDPQDDNCQDDSFDCTFGDCSKLLEKFYGDCGDMVWKIGLTGTVTAVPVPAALPLLISAVLGLGVLTRRRRRTLT